MIVGIAYEQCSGSEKRMFLFQSRQNIILGVLIPSIFCSIIIDQKLQIFLTESQDLKECYKTNTSVDQSDSKVLFSPQEQDNSPENSINNKNKENKTKNMA